MIISEENRQILLAMGQGKKIQYKDSYSIWETIEEVDVLRHILCGATVGQLRVAPDTVTIPSYVIPRPITEALAKDERYWVIAGGEVHSWLWDNDQVDLLQMEMGLLFDTEEKAEAALAALKAAFQEAIKQ